LPGAAVLQAEIRPRLAAALHVLPERMGMAGRDRVRLRADRRRVDEDRLARGLNGAGQSGSRAGGDVTCRSGVSAEEDSHMVWSDLLVPGVPLVEKVVRPLMVYAFLIVGLRLAGKRELAQLNPFDLVVLLTISNTVQNAIIGNDNSVTGGIIGAITLLVVNYAVIRFLYGHERLERLIEGEPDVLLADAMLQTDR